MIEQDGFSSRRLVFAVAAVATLAILVTVLTLVLARTRESALAQQQHDLDAMARMFDRQVAQSFAKIDVVLRLVAREHNRLAALPQNLANDELKAMLETIPESQSLRIVDKTGRFRIDASGTLPDAVIADRAYFLQHKNNPDSGLVFSEPIFARITNNWVITLSRRLSNPDGSFSGHVQAAINADDFRRVFTEITHPPEGSIALLDSKGRLVARDPQVPELLGRVLAETPAQVAIRNGVTSGHYNNPSPVDGVRRVLSLRRVGEYPFYMVVAASEHQALEAWREKAWTYGVSIGFLILLLAALVFVWQRSFNLACKMAARMRSAFENAELQSRQLLDSVPDPAWLRDTTGRYIAVNSAYLGLCGKPREEVIGKRLEDVWPARMAAAFFAIDAKIIATGIPERDVGSQRRPDGKLRHYEYELTPLRDEFGRVASIAGFARDVTERQEAAEQIQFLVGHDTLTTLPNRVSLQSTMARAVAEGRGRNTLIALLLLDVDHFKDVNDTLGPGGGDHILFEIAGRLKETVMEKDTVSRQGGDEFAILINDCGSTAMIAVIAERILDALRRPLLIDGCEIALTASIGISLYPDDGDNFDALLKNADTALYTAKDAGRDNYRFFESEMNALIGERMRLEHDLRQALVRHELFLNYQPQYDALTGRMVGVEALLRWQHPQHGIILPSRFIPIAEETGLIVTIGEWVLEEACRQNAAWQAAGYGPLTVAVNLSARQLVLPGLSAMVSAVLTRNMLDPLLLELEITESVLMHDTDRALRVLGELREIGIKISIDDFGTGYSSLNYLKRLPLDTLKIDQSFVRDLPQDGNDVAITQAIIAISAKLGLTVIAEGVETRAQYEFLRANGCNQVQGFYFSRPRPPDEIPAAFNRGTQVNA